MASLGQLTSEALAARIAFSSAQTPTADKAKERLVRRYGDCPIEQALVLVALGGDGYMLETLHRSLAQNKRLPVYGMNCGTVGFLMNSYYEENLQARIAAAQLTLLYPLVMDAVSGSGQKTTALAFNEVSMLRQLRQAAKLAIFVDGQERLNQLICDGVLVSTPAGSTAYNFSVHGPILPLSSNVLSLMPIAPFRPRRWRGALLPVTAHVQIDVLERDKRPVAAVADFTEVRDVQTVSIREDREQAVSLLFDPDKLLSERIIAEQFFV